MAEPRYTTEYTDADLDAMSFERLLDVLRDAVANGYAIRFGDEVYNCQCGRCLDNRREWDGNEEWDARFTAAH